MADEEIRQRKGEKKGFFGSMSGVQKFILVLVTGSIFFVLWTFIFGGIQNFYQLFFFLAAFAGLLVLFYFIMFAVGLYLDKEPFSPKRDYFTKVVNLAIDLKPTNVHDLYFLGSEYKKRVKGGTIVGILGLPYLIGQIKRHEENKYDGEGKLIAKKDSPMYEYSHALKKKIPVFGKIEYGNDGDTLFVYESGFLIKRRHYLRCHRKLHSDLNGDVDIYDINPVPYGSLWTYPYKQVQESPAKVMIQNQLEVILATHDHQHDLISQVADSAIYFNPAFRLLQKQNAEMVESSG